MPGKIAIIGLGPRGLSALESLISCLSVLDDKVDIHICLFEATDQYGNGPVYNVNQPDCNWLNVPERKLFRDERKALNYNEIQLPAFSSYPAWRDHNKEVQKSRGVDFYPPRGVLGHYLHDRFLSLVHPLKEAGLISIVNEKVTEIVLNNDELQVITEQNSHGEFDEVLLTIGHQPTEDDDQILEWIKYSNEHPDTYLFTEPYPIERILESQALNPSNKIGIRGFGLAMIDVVRAIAEYFGEFITKDESSGKLEYKTTHDISNLIIPFSLDGLPMSPKPLNAHIDEMYQPNKNQLAAFCSKIGNKRVQKEAVNPNFLIDAFTPLAATIYRNLPFNKPSVNYKSSELISIIRNWLLDAEYTHPLITNSSMQTEFTMNQFVEMAIATNKIYLDYCIGQVWRHCQPSIYKYLSYNHCSDEVCHEIIQLDERMKRYSFGPPVESIQQLLALIESGVLNLEYVNNPEIELKTTGWMLQKKNESITTNVMINSVLDPPKLKAVKAPVIKNLLEDRLVKAVHDDLGVVTDEYGYVISKDTEQKLRIALLGRLAKGTIIGVDALAECFGERPEKWAKECTRRLLRSY